MPHMVGDIQSLAATKPRKIVKEPPKRVNASATKRLLLTKEKLPKEEKIILPKTELTDFPKEPVLPPEPLNEPPS